MKNDLKHILAKKISLRRVPCKVNDIHLKHSELSSYEPVFLKVNEAYISEDLAKPSRLIYCNHFEHSSCLVVRLNMRHITLQGLNRASGFSLIELMIVVMIVAIFAAIAIPSYAHYIERKDLAIAKQEALRLATELERFKAKNYSYKGFNAGYLYGSSASTDSDGNTIPVNYYNNTLGQLSLPLGASEAEKKYTLTLWDIAEKSPLTSADVEADVGAGIAASKVNGLGWMIFIERARDGGGDPKQPRNYDLLLTSNGTRCMTKVKDSIKDKNYASCGDYSESW